MRYYYLEHESARNTKKGQPEESVPKNRMRNTTTNGYVSNRAT